MTALPINVEELLKGQIVEWERLEFKKGWDPEKIIHTLCAFANDINNWGGGYLILGVEEKKGQPVFPPLGLSPQKIDQIQKDIVNLSYKLRPNYHPIVAPVMFQGKMILLIWCPGGQTRPYQAPEILGKKSLYSHFIRRNSTTTKAQTKDVQQLYEMANHVPFDDRICHQATLEDLDIGLIKDFLRNVNSTLINEVDKISFEQLCRHMQIVQGPEEYLKPLNIGLMLFNNHPEIFFPYARIEIVYFHDTIGDSFSEKIFKGPIHLQLKEALRYLESMFIREEVRKRPDRAEADRFYTYPYIALEEALANAVYHKDYARREPIEVSIKPDRIEILSFPGPLPPLKIEDLNNGTAKVRTYRNRRIGDFLKELHLTEGRCTGVPKIYRAMKANGSPPALFETDAEFTYFLTTLPIHAAASLSLHSNNGVNLNREQTHQYTGVFNEQTHQYTGVFALQDLEPLINNLSKNANLKDLRHLIQKICSEKALTAQQLAIILKRKDKKHLVRKLLTPMIREGLLKYAHSEDRNSPEQSYVTCDKEERL